MLEIGQSRHVMWNGLCNCAVRNHHRGLRQERPQLVTEPQDQRGLQLFCRSIQVFGQHAFTAYFLGALSFGDKISKADTAPALKGFSQVGRETWGEETPR